MNKLSPLLANLISAFPAMLGLGTLFFMANPILRHEQLFAGIACLLITAFALFYSYSGSAILEKKGNLFRALFLIVASVSLLIAPAWELVVQVSRLRMGLLILLGISSFLFLQQHFSFSVNKSSDESVLSLNRNGLDYSNNSWSSYLGLLLIVFLGFALRIYDLDFLPSFRDEDHHVFAAHSYLQNGFFEYGRAKLVTYSAVICAWFSGTNSFHDVLAAGRIPSVIFGALTAIPIYFIGRNSSKSLGLLAAFLWSVSPWAIGVARVVREHSIYAFVICLAMLLFVWMCKSSFYEVGRAWEKSAAGKNKILGLVSGVLVLLVLLAYAFFIDRLSTLKVVAAILAAQTIAFFISRPVEIVQALKNNKGLLLIAGLAVGVFASLISRVKHIQLSSVPDLGWPDTFFHSAANIPMHWWQGDGQDPYLVFSLLIIGWTGIVYFKDRFSAWNYFAFFIVLLAYFLFFNRYYFPRYIFYILPMFVLFISASLYHWWRLIEFKSSLGTNLSRFAMLLAVLLSFSPVNSWTAWNPGTNDLNALRTTGEFHNDKQVALDYLTNRLNGIHPDSIPIVSSIYDYVIYQEFSPECVIKYQYKDPERIGQLMELVDSISHGVILLDQHRNVEWAKGLPVDSLQRAFEFGKKEMQLVVNRNRCQIYEWRPLPPKPDYDSLCIRSNGIVDFNKKMSLSFWVEPELLPEGNVGYFSDGSYPTISLRHRLESEQWSLLSWHYALYDELAVKTLRIPRTGKKHHVLWHQLGGIYGTPAGFYLDGFELSNWRVPSSIEGRTRFYINKNASDSFTEMRLYPVKLRAEEIRTYYRRKMGLGVSALRKTNENYQLIEWQQ